MKNIKTIYENDDLAVLDKPAGLVTHKINNYDTQYTLVDYITKKWPIISNPPTGGWPDKSRPGIIHRLDKDTSGLILIAKNPKTLNFLQNQFKQKNVKKLYLLLCLGETSKLGEIKTYTNKDTKKYNKQKISLLNVSWKKGRSKLAITNYKTLNYYIFENQTLSLVEAKIKTGRTHQIRNHFKYIDHPIIGDQMYFTKNSKRISDKLNIKRQFLQSFYLKFTNTDNKTKIVKIPLEKKLDNILSTLKKR